ncbi:MAG: nickel pincer cofactor biosynthesis protein LarC [Clostridia bacterium]|nr:nickel pincer cofactor biosynthesis protein LarC [Clostridia bacterium]
MKAAYLDCFSGISGDMMLGALVDAGVSFKDLKNYLDGLGMRGYTMTCESVVKRGMSAKKINIIVHDEQPARHLSDITELIQNSSLPKEVKKISCDVFKRLTEAEAKVHGMPIDKVHLHEVGAVDAILDIVGSCLGLHLLGVEKVFSSPLPPGGGTVECQHGVIPVPAPAALELIKGIPTAPSPVKAELVTPTGAALAATLAEGFGEIPPMKINQVGIGAGTKDFPHANILRIMVGELAKNAGFLRCGDGSVNVLEASIDDMNPEFYTYLSSRLMEAGALDYFYTPIYMKKNRPGTLITVLCDEENIIKVKKVLFNETSTLGCRIKKERRARVKYEFLEVETPFGSIDVKSCVETGTFSPEYSQCEKLAHEKGVPLKNIYDMAKAAAMKGKGLI